MQEIRKVSLDPLKNINEYLHELIFQHLDGPDSLKASEVSWSWFEATEDSPKSWQQLTLHVNEEKFKKIDRLVSSRKYQNVLLQLVDIEDSLRILGLRTWRSVTLFSTEYELKDFKRILMFIEGTVEKLRVESVRVRSSQDESQMTSAQWGHENQLTFRNLKSLTMFSCDGLTLLDIIGECRTLKNLSLNVAEDETLNDNDFNVLENNINLERLEVYYVTNFPITSTVIHRYQLKELSISSENWDANWRDDDGLLLTAFLQSQAGSLKKLHLNPLPNCPQKVKMVLEIPNLKNLSIRLHREINTGWDEVKLRRNYAIEAFKMTSCRRLNGKITKFMTEMFQSMPNLKQLHVECLNVSALRSLGQNCRNIEFLSFTSLADDIQKIRDLPDFPNIREFKCSRSEISKDLLAEIQEKSADHQTRLEKLILESK